MKKNGMKALAATLACTMALGVTPPVKDVPGMPSFSVTAEAATKKLTVNVSGKTIYAGKTARLGAKVTKGAKVTYKSSNKSIAAINAKGILAGKKPGTARITITVKKAKYKTVKKTVKVKVVKQSQKITASSNQTVTAGNAVKLDAKAKTLLSYKSSDSKIATVSSKGVVTGKNAGTVKITITAKATGIYNKATKTITVKVTPKAATPPKQTEAVTQPEKEDNRKPDTAPGDQTEKVTEVPAQSESTEQTEVPDQTEGPKQTEPETEKPGQTEKPDQTETEKPAEPPKETEKPTEPPKETEAPKPEISYVTGLYFEETAQTNTIYVGEPKSSTLKWTATGNTTLQDFIYTTSDPSIATVDENGTITGHKMGDVRITATAKTPYSPYASDCLSVTQKYHIKVHTTKLDSICYPVIVGEDAITEKNISIGETKECTLELRSMEDCSIAEVEFDTSDPSVATVDEQGNVTGHSKGYVTITARSKLPSEMDGETILTSSTTYHVGEYTYEEILDGLTMDAEAGWSAHETMNDLRQNPDHRNFFRDYPSYPEREWDAGILRNAVTRASRNIVCYILGGWKEDEMSAKNPLASHGGAFNGYGGCGWESTGTELGKAASVFFEDAGHFGNETDPYFKYEAVAVVQYKNPTGVNITSLIVEASGESYKNIVTDYQKRGESYVKQCIKVSQIPESQYIDFCNHFGIPTTDPEVTDAQTLAEVLLPVEAVTESAAEVPDDVIIQDEDADAEPEMIIEEETEETLDEAAGEEPEVLDEVPEEILEEEITE